MVGIYEIRNLVNGKVYIGQSIDIDARLKAHKERETNQHLKSAFKKYGLKNFYFSVLKECKKEDLSFYEHFYIIANCSFDERYGYNNTLGGEEYSIFSEKSLQKISDGVKKGLANSEKWKNYCKRRIGQKRSKETKEKMSESAKNSWKKGRDISNYKGGVTPENMESRRLKSSLAQTGKIVLNDGKIQVSIRPEDINLYLERGFQRGRLPFSSDTKKKMSESAKKRCIGRDMSTTTGKKIMNKPGEKDTYFSLDEVQEKLKDGWKLGRSLK